MISDAPESETTAATIASTDLAFGLDATCKHSAFDTPGLGDTQGRDWDFITPTIELLRGYESGVNVIILVIPLGSRITTNFQLAFKMLPVAFGNGAELWDHTCLVLIKCLWDRRVKWQPTAVSQAQRWQTRMREMGRDCPGDRTWNYELSVFFIDNDLDLISTSEDEMVIWEDRAVRRWWERSQQSFGVLPFKSEKEVGIKDDRLHSMFDFMLF
jgi:hypothetical protein